MSEFWVGVYVLEVENGTARWRNAAMGEENFTLESFRGALERRNVTLAHSRDTLERRSRALARLQRTLEWLRGPAQSHQRSAR